MRNLPQNQHRVRFCIFVAVLIHRTKYKETELKEGTDRRTDRPNDRQTDRCEDEWSSGEARANGWTFPLSVRPSVCPPMRRLMDLWRAIVPDQPSVGVSVFSESGRRLQTDMIMEHPSHPLITLGTMAALFLRQHKSYESRQSRDHNIGCHVVVTCSPRRSPPAS